MDTKFQQLWQERLQPWLEGLEKERKQAVKSFLLWLVIAIALGLGGLAIGGAMGGDDNAIPVIIGLILAVLALAAGHSKLDKLRKRVKEELNTAIAEACGMAYSVRPYSPARFSTFRQYDLLPVFNRKHFEDHFSGEVDGCDFELYEAHLEQRRRSKNRTYYVTVFRGVLMRITFPRKVEGVTVITRDQGWLNSLQKLSRSFGSTKLERIGLVDPRFEKAFEVYGNDQVLARYMLTPSFMERLLDLEKALKGKRVRAMFDEHSGKGELLIAAETGNLFEVGSMWKPLADQGRIKTIIDELSLVTGLVKMLVESGLDSDDVKAMLDRNPDA